MNKTMLGMVVAAAMMLFANAPAVADHVHPDQIKPVPHHTPVPPPTLPLNQSSIGRRWS